MTNNIENVRKTLPAAPETDRNGKLSGSGTEVNDYIVSFRENTINEVTESPLYINYKSNNYLVDCGCPRFGSGEAKGVLKETIRGTDLFIMTDVCNYGLTYTVNGHVNHMSPDDHYQDLKESLLLQPERHVVSMLSCLSFMRADSINVPEENLSTVHLPLKN